MEAAEPANVSAADVGAPASLMPWLIHQRTTVVHDGQDVRDGVGSWTIIRGLIAKVVRAEDRGKAGMKTVSETISTRSEGRDGTRW